jgi:hypothetical protein
MTAMAPRSIEMAWRGENVADLVGSLEELS